jgi:hypothetical protein
MSACRGVSWRVVACRGVSWRVVACRGVSWRVVAWRVCVCVCVRLRRRARRPPVSVAIRRVLVSWVCPPDALECDASVPVLNTQSRLRSHVAPRAPRARFSRSRCARRLPCGRALFGGFLCRGVCSAAASSRVTVPSWPGRWCNCLRTRLRQCRRTCAHWRRRQVCVVRAPSCLCKKGGGSVCVCVCVCVCVLRAICCISSVRYERARVRDYEQARSRSPSPDSAVVVAAAATAAVGLVAAREGGTEHIHDRDASDTDCAGNGLSLANTAVLCECDR